VEEVMSGVREVLMDAEGALRGVGTLPAGEK